MKNALFKKLNLNKFQICKILFLLIPLLSIIFIFFLLNLNKNIILNSQFQNINLTITPSIYPEVIRKEKRDKYVQYLINNMALEEKIGQMFMWGISEASLSAEIIAMLKDTHAGGVIIMNDLNHKYTPQQINKLTHEINKLNKKTPLFIAIDGEIELIKNKISGFEYENKILEYMDEDKFCSEVTDISNFLYDNGINTNLGIIADIGWNEDYIRNRTYGSTPDSVKDRVSKAIECSNKKILTAAKHFPGHGRTKEDSHKSTPIINIDYNEWLKTDKIPFQEAINKQVDFVMMGHLKYINIDPNEPGSLSLTHHNNIRQMGFNGITITDDLGMLKASEEDPKTILNKAINANNDILLSVTLNLKPMEIISHVISNVKNNNISIKRINDSVERILRAKYLLIDQNFKDGQ